MSDEDETSSEEKQPPEKPAKVEQPTEDKEPEFPPNKTYRDYTILPTEEKTK